MQKAKAYKSTTSFNRVPRWSLGWVWPRFGQQAASSTSITVQLNSKVTFACILDTSCSYAFRTLPVWWKWGGTTLLIRLAAALPWGIVLAPMCLVCILCTFQARLVHVSDISYVHALQMHCFSPIQTLPWCWAVLYLVNKQFHSVALGLHRPCKGL